jgi:transposase
MPATRISMRKTKELLRLKFALCLSDRKIAACLGIARSTVAEYLGRIAAAGITWPLPGDLDEHALEQLLFPDVRHASGNRPLPDWTHVDHELRRKGVTLMLLWQEYIATHPNGYHYSQFCNRYRQWHARLDVAMRQNHKAGHKLFVDYAGHTIDVVDSDSGEIRQAQIFVATLGASNYTFCEATWNQSQASWIASHRRAFEFFGGVPAIVVPDNLKSGVSKAHRYEPDINRSYAEMAEHYGVAIIPARSRKPRDKAKVEAAVQLVERWILAVLRNRTFFCLAEVNQAIAELLIRLNDRAFQKLPGSRRSVFEQLDRPALKPLPEHPFVFAAWKKARVNLDYHIEVERHYYSVPHTYARRQLDVRITETTIECFDHDRRVASHPRSMHKGRYTTTPEHMPRAHQAHAGWTHERIMQWARKIGEATAELVERIIALRAHPEQGYRSCLGLRRLSASFGADRLEAAARRALALGGISYKSIESILKKGLDRQPLPEDITARPAIAHDNIRGPAYYCVSAADVSAAGTEHSPINQSGDLSLC